MASLGSPASPTATRVMLLGSGELGKEVLIALQRLGVETTAADRYAGAPGQQVAHHARTLTMSDPAQLREAITAEVARVPGSPLVVVPEIEALATDVLVELEADGTVRVVPTARAARLTMDREGIRRLAAEELGLPTSAYRFCDSAEELAAGAAAVGFPCVVKPVVSSSGKGQSTLRGPEDVATAWQHAQAGARVGTGRVIAEAFVDFEYEITLLTVRAVDPATGEVATSFCEPIGHRQESGDYVESWQPQRMSDAALARAREVAAAVTGELGGQGLFGVELFVRGDEVWFSEVSPRPHDTGLVTLATQWQNEFELHARALLGLPVDTSLRGPGASAVVYGGVEGSGVVFDGVGEALAVPGVDLRLFGKPESSAHRRLGVVVARALPEDVPGGAGASDGEVTDGARGRATRAASLVRPRLG